MRGIRVKFSILLVGICFLLGLCSAWANAQTTSSQPTVQPLRVVYFYSSTCPYCHKVDAFLPKIEKKWGSRIKVERYGVDDMKVFMQMFAYEEHYGSDEEAPPKIFLGKSYMADDQKIIKQLDGLISRELAAGSVTFVPFVPESDTGDLMKGILRRFESFEVGAVAVAGLFDGINPCAFTTIVFMISMLGYLRKTRRQILVIGAGFTIGVFVTYFLLGLGAFGAIKCMAVQSGLSRGFAFSVAVFTFFLAVWSFWDFVKLQRSRNVADATLGLPKSIKKRIHTAIREGLSTRWLAAGAFGVGCVVSLLESLCTGQIYLPTIVFVSRTAGVGTKVLGYLALYNAMFILPLVVLLGLGCWGVKSERLGNILRKHLGVFKFAMACLFLFLGILVLFTA